MGLPRVLELGSDNRLIMTPVEELERLRYNEKSLENVVVPADGEVGVEFDAVEPNAVELEVEFAPTGAGQYGVRVCASPDREEETVIGYDAGAGKLGIDTRRSGLGQEKKAVEAAPLPLGDGEGLKLRIFVDKSIVEVFANDGRLVLSRRVYPEREDSTGISLFAQGGEVRAEGVRIWDVMPTNPY